LCVSGINHGANSSINVIYSGTMSAAMEAAIEGIPAIGFSLLDYSFDADFGAAKKVAAKVAAAVLKNGLPDDTLLNVNIPKLPFAKLKGIKVCRQASGKYDEEFDQRIDPRNTKYYWLTGKFAIKDNGEDTDEWALAQGYHTAVKHVFLTFGFNHSVAFRTGGGGPVRHALSCKHVGNVLCASAIGVG